MTETRVPPSPAFTVAAHQRANGSARASHPIVVDGWRKGDWESLATIAVANGLAELIFQPTAQVLIARYRGLPVAVAALRDVPPETIVIDEIWSLQSRIGVAGIGRLMERIEGFVQRMSDERGKPIELGGMVLLANARHKAALQKRGCRVIGEVLSKRYMPHG